ncbi:hypothetical protein H312_01867 [Anncaliia algerae PRA339]|uniref:Uncharacterized protein n=1 Tax=Anncaliia algerae PRA339 TaxID=1288291 RepID=A0A059F0L6_9MICR|nr:hypothetical protein H312_01867 [Anncaliia algerae PRA339]
MINQPDQKQNNYNQENSNTLFNLEPKEDPFRRNNRENISNIINRRNRLLNHIKKEQLQISMPDTRPFLNERHAIECLLPYHIFYRNTPEDFLFNETKVADKEIDVNPLIQEVENLIKESEKRIENGYTIILDLMDLEAHKFIYNKYNTLYNELFEKINKKNAQAKKIKVNQKTLPIIKIPLNDDIFLSYKYVRAVNGKLFFKKK